MVEKIFMIWHDYDGTYIEKFEANGQGIKRAEKRCALLLAGDDNGTRINAVIKGRELKIETMEVVTRVSLK